MVSAQNWASVEFKSCCPKPCVADNWNLPGQRFHHLSEPLFQCLTMTLGKFLLMFLMISAWSLLFLPPHSSLIFHTVWLDLSCPQSVSQICGHTLVPSWLFLACFLWFILSEALSSSTITWSRSTSQERRLTQSAVVSEFLGKKLVLCFLKQGAH